MAQISLHPPSAATFRFSFLLLVVVLSALLARGAEIRWTVHPQSQVDADGIFFSQLVDPNPAVPSPHVRLFDAPVFGQTLSLTQTQIWAALSAAFPEVGPDLRLNGAPVVKVSRSVRSLNETELKEMLGAVLQRDHVRQKGELELRFNRPWKTIAVPDDELTVKILDLPNVGVSPSFVVRFELVTSRETVGTWHLAVQARVWKELWVARSPLQRGDALVTADLARERRDVLPLRESIFDQETLSPTMEVAQAIPAGAPLMARLVRLRPVIRRGQVVAAQLQQGPIQISLKVEALQEGAPGELIRVRNIQSKRELRGKVYDDQTIEITL